MQFKVLLIAALAPLALGHSGKATYYDPDGGYGACGTTLQNSDYAIALSTDQYNNGANCGREISITHDGTTVIGWVEDECPGCDEYQLDLAQGLFEQFASTDVGVIDITWNYAT